jgi:hypothetical protein
MITFGAIFAVTMTLITGDENIGPLSAILMIFFIWIKLINPVLDRI